MGKADTGGRRPAERSLRRSGLASTGPRLWCGRAGRYVKSACELAGLAELAARVPPRVARKDRRKSSSRPLRLSEEMQRSPRQRLLDLANVVDLGRWVKRRSCVWGPTQAGGGCSATIPARSLPALRIVSSLFHHGHCFEGHDWENGSGFQS